MSAAPQLSGRFLHQCTEWDFMLIDETCDEFSACSCFQPTTEFLTAQDKINVAMDLRRGTAGT